MSQSADAEKAPAAESAAAAAPSTQSARPPLSAAMHQLYEKEATHAHNMLRLSTTHGLDEIQRTLIRDAAQWLEQKALCDIPDDTLEVTYSSSHKNATEIAMRIATIYYLMRNYTQAITWSTHAQDHGDKRASHNLAVLELQRVHPDNAKVVALMQEAAFVQSIFCISLLVLPTQPMAAKTTLEVLAGAPRHHARAAYVLGTSHMNELFDNESSVAEAKRYLTSAGMAGEAIAWRHLALLQRSLNEPYAETAKRGADAFDVGCCTIYGTLLCTGDDGVKKDRKIGANYLSRAGSDGCIGAKYAHVSMCFTKKSQSKEYVAGIKNLAEKDMYAPALHDLATLMYAGKYGVTADPAQSAKALRASVEMGFIPSIIFALTNDFITPWHRHYTSIVAFVLRTAANDLHIHQELAKTCAYGLKLCVQCAGKLLACSICTKIYCLKCNGSEFEEHIRVHASMGQSAHRAPTAD